jgi:hypothetical protein
MKTIMDKFSVIETKAQQLQKDIDAYEGVKHLEVQHELQSEHEIQIDRGEGFCDHDCTSMCRHEGCMCMCGEWHIAKNL